MNEDEGFIDSVELIDKLMGYADNQPLILNHLAVLRQSVVASLAVHRETAENYATLEAQVGHFHTQGERKDSLIEELRVKVSQLNAELAQIRNPPFGAESIPVIDPRDKFRGL